MDLLVGSTGFVGGNLLAAHGFSAARHSSDIALSYGTAPDLCVYAGVPAAMFLANADPQADLAVMIAARENLRRIHPQRLVLISSIAVYPDSRGRTESDAPDAGDPALSAYGRNRRQLEQWVRQDFPSALIVRLPALYGKGLKKNFLYDLHTITPALLTPARYQQLAGDSELVRRGYSPADNGFYRCNGQVDPAALRGYFAGSRFNALSFTDSRSRYQFYPLRRLWQDICTALDLGLTCLNLTPPPVCARRVFEAVTGKTGWSNLLDRPPYDYDLRSEHAALFGGAQGYLCTEQQELEDICRFMRQWRD